MNIIQASHGLGYGLKRYDVFDEEGHMLRVTVDFYAPRKGDRNCWRGAVIMHGSRYWLSSHRTIEKMLAAAKKFLKKKSPERV